MEAPVKPGDRVWYYFQHAFSKVEQIDEVAHIEVFTGKTEMRCRPARVLVMEAFDGAWWAGLQVEFDDSDRRLHTGGVVQRFERDQYGALEADSAPPRMWPSDHTWSRTEKRAG